jgi:hypothetical protein
VKLELRINGENVDPLSCIAHRSKAFFVGRELTKKLKTLIPRAQFKIPIQAAIGGKVRPCVSCALGGGSSYDVGVYLAMQYRHEAQEGPRQTHSTCKAIWHGSKPYYNNASCSPHHSRAWRTRAT